MLKKINLLYVALGGGMLCTLVHLIFSVDLYRDSAGVYVYMARALSTGNFSEAFHPGIPHLNIFCAFPFTLVGLSPEKSVTLVSCLFYLATIPFLYFLLREFIPEKLAGTGAVLFALSPRIIRFFCAALIDSGKVFFMIAGLYYGYKIIKSRFSSWLAAVGFGVSLGLLALSRSEGIGNAVFLFFCIGISCCKEIYNSKKSAAFLKLLVSAAVAGILLVSRIIISGVFCGQWIYDKRINDGICKILSFLTGSGIAATDISVDAFDSSWGHLLKQNIRGANELYLVFSLLGLALLVMVHFRKNNIHLFPSGNVPGFIRWHNFYWVFLFSIIFNMLLFKASKILAHRYFLLNIPLLMVFTLIGMYWLWCFVRPGILQKIMVFCCAVILFFQAYNGLSRCLSPESRIDYNTGLYLKQNLRPGEVVFFGKAASVFYYSELPRAVPIEAKPVDLNQFTDFKYVICTDKDRNRMVCESRNDLREIKIPVKNNVRVFEKIK